MNFKQKLFLTAALTLTTMVGKGQTQSNTVKNDKQTNKTEQSVNQSVTVGVPEELVKIIPGDKNTGFPRIVDVDISKELGLEPGRRIASYFNNSDKPGEFLTKYGPFHPSDDISDPDYREKLNKAAESSYKKVSPFLKANKAALDNSFSQQGISEIDYKRNQVTFSYDDGYNFTVNIKNKTIVPSVFKDMRAGFVALEGEKPLPITQDAPKELQDMLRTAEATIAIGAKSGNTYVTKPSQLKP